MKKMSFKTRLFFSTASFFLFIVAFGINAMAQAGTATINGSVTDAQGGAIAGANVRLANDEKGFSRTVVSSASGAYSFSNIPPDKYQITVEAKGFKKLVVSNVTALVDKSTEANAMLEAGNITEVVNVSGGDLQSIVNTQDASLGNNFVSQQIQQLPLEGRNVVNLLSLQPAVTPDGAVAGGRQDQANITLDGVDVNDQQTGLNLTATEAFTAVLRVTPDSIGEFRVTTSNPDASKGRSAGAQVSLITKSGTNDLHGNLFEYHRNTKTTANDWFSNAAGNYGATDSLVVAGLARAGDERVPRPKLIRNLYGGSLGGPIKKDRFFFFYNYEGLREAKDTPISQVVPLANLGKGEIVLMDQLLDSNGQPVGAAVKRTLTLAQLNALTVTGGTAAGNVVDVNPITMQILAAAAARYPANAPGGDGLNTGVFRFNAPLPVRQNTHTAKFDWNITSNQTHIAGIRLNYQADIFARASAFPDTPSGNRWSHPSGMALSYTWIASNTLTNRFNYGLTRLAYSLQGDSGENAITFRDIFTPLNFTRTFSRVNPTNNYTDDLTWVKGNHTWQFGTNIRVIRNKLTNLASAFDNGTTNFGFYPQSGASVLTPLNQFLTANFPVGPGQTRIVQSASQRSAQSSLVALLGRVNQYTANFVFDIDGKPVSAAPTVREWATEEYDWYVQDSWKFRSNLTVNLGLRYGLSRPVYETQGFQAAPNIPLDVYFERRRQAAFNGQNYTELLTVDKAGPKNGKPDFYEWDKNNWQPRISAAWSPDAEKGIFGKIFGSKNTSVIRGGFAITNDYFGQQLAVQFDAANTLGFVSRFTTPANTFNLTTNPAPLISGLGMNIRNLPGVVTPTTLTFPQQQSANFSRRIESSIDRGVKSPINYSWNLTFGRTLPGKMYLETSYVARLARNLLATRDVMTPNNLRDPATGVDYYTEASRLELLKRAGTSVSGVAPSAYWDNLYGPGTIANATLFGFGCVSGVGINNTRAVYEILQNCIGDNDWTDMQNLLDNFSGKRLFYQSQYGALDSFGTIAKSNYHGGTVSLRQRLSTLTWDFNYTFSKSLDDTSGLQTAGAFGAAFILNPLRQSDNYAPSDFDMRHIINFNSVWQLPIGKGRKWMNGTSSFVNGIIGGWQFSTIFRYNSGDPIGTTLKYFDNAGWITNWNLKSAMVQIRPIETGVFHHSDDTGLPNMFANQLEALKSFRSPLPGETGDRNRLRFPAFYTADIGLHKAFDMPWKEGHKMTVRWEVFNVTNTPIFTGVAAARAMGYNPLVFSGTKAPTGFGDYTGTSSNSRVMQFALRYDF